MDDDARQSAGTRGAAEALERLARGLRSRVATAPGEERRARADGLRRHVEEYLLPRAADLDAPLLVVLLGSTGSGKSSLLNALVGAQVSPSGVLRPTTRQPIAVGHRDDLGGRIGAVAERSGSSCAPTTARAAASSSSTRPTSTASRPRTGSGRSACSRSPIS